MTSRRGTKGRREITIAGGAGGGEGASAFLRFRVGERRGIGGCARHLIGMLLPPLPLPLPPPVGQE